MSRSRRTRAAVSGAGAPPLRRLRLLLAVLGVLGVLALFVNAGPLRVWLYRQRTPDQLLAEAREHRRDPLVARVAAERLLAAGRPAEAWELVAPHVDRSPIEEELLLAAGRAVWGAGDRARAAQLLDRAMTTFPRSARARYWSAELLRESNRLREAEALLREAVRLQPDLARAWLRLGEISLQQDHPAQALEDLARAGPSGDAARLRARALLALGRLPEAERAARDAVRREPAAASFSILGEVLQASGSEAGLRSAREQFARALELDAGDVVTMKLLAVNYRTAGEDREAVKVLRRMLRIAPGMAEGYPLLAQAYRSLGKDREAAACDRIFRKLQPLQQRVSRARYRLTVEERSLDARLELARAYLELGRNDLALRTLERARPEASSNPDVAALIRRAGGPPAWQIPPLPADPEGDRP